MKLTHSLALTVAACGLASSAIAQDSVSPAGALPGDALSVYDASEACNAYVLDMVDFTASWGTALRIGPVLKSPAMPNTLFYNNLISAHAISGDVVAAASYPRGSYQVWSTAGAGINDQINSAPGTVSPSGSSLQFGVAIADFGTSAEGSSYNGVHAAVVNYDPANDSRLYVTRLSAAVNGLAGTENRSQMGFGVIDANGNTTFRVDDFGTTGPNKILEDNIFRTRILNRTCGSLNIIDNSGGSDATDWLVVRSVTSYTVPSAIPQSVAGRPVYAGPNYAAQYAYEVAPNTVVATGSHLQGATDHRGSMPVSPQPFFGRSGAVATLGVLVYPAGASTADAVSIWDVDTNGNVLNPGAQLVLPTSGTGGLGSVTDNNDGFSISGGASGWSFDGYHSQTGFRGGSGSVALRRTAAGDRLIAGTAYDLLIGGTDNPSNAVVVAKHDTTSGATAWTLAGYYDANLDAGKAIKDGPGGAVIGQMTGMFKVTGGVPLGPSISQPAFDCAGNCYFVAAAELFTDFGSDFDVVLLRAVYDPANFSYELELLAQSGDTFNGANSATPYQITFINLADSNSIDSASFFAHNVTGACWGGTDPADLDGSTDPRAVGGVLLNSRITYDTNGDGAFDNTVDENYRTVLLITGTGAAPDPCAYADCDGNGVVDTRDFTCFFNQWVPKNAAADCDGNGIVDTRDFTCFLNQWANCR